MIREQHDGGRICLCMATHRPAPLELVKHRLLPGEHGGTYAEDNVVWLCPTTHVNVHELLRFFVDLGFTPSFYEVTALYEAPVSRYAYQIAAKGHDLIRGYS